MGLFGVKNALMSIPSHQTIELSPQRAFQLPNDHFRKENKTASF